MLNRKRYSESHTEREGGGDDDDEVNVDRDGAKETREIQRTGV